MNTVERELKLRPLDPALLDRLAEVAQFGEFAVKRRRVELQSNSFYDTPSRALSRARLGFRRRLIRGQPLATWTLKADSQWLRGVATRTEIEVQLELDIVPWLALAALRDAASQRGALALAAEVDDALADGSRPLDEPFLEMETNRRVRDLESAAHGWHVELALDQVRLLGHTYAEVEIEAELKAGDAAALDAIRLSIESFGAVEESRGGKLSRALAHLEACHCERTDR